MDDYEADPEHSFTSGEEGCWVDFIRWQMPSLFGSSILDVGCGTGFLSVLLARNSGDVTGLDNNPLQLDIAQARLDDDLTLQMRLQYILGNAEDRALFDEQRFDWIVSRQAICYLRDARSTFSVWARWLKPKGGVFLVDGYWPLDTWDPPPDPRQAYASVTSPDLVARDLTACGFEVTLSRDMHEINNHRRIELPEGRTRYVVIARKP